MRAAHPHPRRPEGPTVRGERGIVVIEMALVALLLIALAAGAYDYGQAWRSGLAVNEATRTGARVGSAMGNDRLADFYALSGAKAALQSSGKLGQVQRVVIFRSSSENGKVPTACTTLTSPTQACNIIDGNTFRSNWSEANFGSSGCFTGVATAQRWCPTSRNDMQLTADYFGIWIDFRHDFEFPLMGSDTGISKQAVMRLEPQET